jgi:hypothetical protein
MFFFKKKLVSLPRGTWIDMIIRCSKSKIIRNVIFFLVVRINCINIRIQRFFSRVLNLPIAFQRQELLN